MFPRTNKDEHECQNFDIRVAFVFHIRDSVNGALGSIRRANTNVLNISKHSYRPAN